MYHPIELQDQPFLSMTEREQRQRQRLQREMKEQDRLKYADPDRDTDLSKVWTVYQWDDRKCVWLLAGFRRRRKRRKTQTMNRFFSKVRRKLQIDKKTPVMLVDLQTAQLLSRRADKSWMHEPPKRQTALRPAEIPAQPKIPKHKRHVTRIRKSRATPYSLKKTAFVAFGRRPTDREPGYLYLGPLVATTKKAAEQEAKQLFQGLWPRPLVLRTADMSKRLRKQLRKRIRPAVDRVLWPEPMPLPALLALPASQLGAITAADVAYHTEQMTRLAWRAAKSKKKDRTKDVAHALGVLTFLDIIPTTLK